MTMASTAETSPVEELPLIPEQITTEWLGSKLGHKIKSISLTRTIFGTGSKLLYSIEYAKPTADPASRPANVCIKGMFVPAMAEAVP